MKSKIIHKPEIYFILFISFFIFLFFLKNFNIWEFLIVPQLPDETFYDFRCLQQWTELRNIFFSKSEIIYSSSEEIYDTRAVCILNHPRIWILISSFLNLNNELYFMTVVYFLILAYILIFFYYIKKFKSFFLIYFFFSGSSLLLVERANNDIIIFLLLFIVTYINYKPIKYFLFFLSSCLKIYPIFGVLYFLKGNDKYKIIFIISLIIIIFFVATYNDIIYLVTNTPKTGGISYGSLAISLNILKYFDFYINQHLISFFLILSTLVIYKNIFRKKILNEIFFHDNVFLLGSSIFLLTFLIGSHFDYRLIFLFFTIPTLINLNNNFLRYLTLIIIFLSLETFRLNYFFGFFGGIINTSAKIILFISFACLTIDILSKKIFLLK